MFTGIITDIGTIASVKNAGNQLRELRIHSIYDAETIAIGASIACNGICLTVTQRGVQDTGCWFEVTAAQETLSRTTLHSWKEGDQVNLERALKIGDELGGHIVTGHVDGVAEILRIEHLTASDTAWGATARFFIRSPLEIAKFIAEKGSITLDGASLTVNNVEDDVFSILLIPHTMKVTTWGQRKVSDLVNIEVDMMARYAARLSQCSQK